jgi:hypothetical protein
MAVSIEHGTRDGKIPVWEIPGIGWALDALPP